jgi:hypothetical protein
MRPRKEDTMHPDRLLFSHNDVTAQEYHRSEHDGKRYALNVSGMVATFSSAQWATLAEYFGADCSAECEGPRLDKPLPANWAWNDALPAEPMQERADNHPGKE